MAVKNDEYYDDRETLSSEKRLALLEERLRRQIEHVYQNCPATGQIMAGAGLGPADIRSVTDLARLPITRKEDVIHLQQENPPYGGLVAGDTADIERVFISPGPVYEIQASDIQWFARAFWAAGFRRGQVVINTFTYHLSPAGILMHEGLRNCGATVVVTGTGNTEIQLRAINHLGVNGFIGTPSFLMALIARAEELGGDFGKDYGLKRAWFTGEPLAPSVRETLEDKYKIGTFQAYAVTEPGGVIGYECHCKNGFHLVDDYVLEIVDPVTGKAVETGQPGEIVVTPVHSPAWGLVRFGTGDLSSLDTGECPCGRTAPRLTGIMGRTGEAVKVRGMFVVKREIDELVSSLGQISCYQMVVDRYRQRDRVELVVSLKKEAGNRHELISLIGNAFRSRCRLNPDSIRVVEEEYFSTDYRAIEDKRRWD